MLTFAEYQRLPVISLRILRERTGAIKIDARALGSTDRWELLYTLPGGAQRREVTAMCRLISR